MFSGIYLATLLKSGVSFAGIAARYFSASEDKHLLKE
jgi:hypothetical protein